MTSSHHSRWPAALLVVALLAALGGAGWAALPVAAGAAVWLLSSRRASAATPPRHATSPATPTRRSIEEPMWGVWPAAAAGAAILANDRSGRDDAEVPGEDGGDECDAVADLGPVHAEQEPAAAPEVADAEQAWAGGAGAGGWGDSAWRGCGGWGDSGWSGGGGWGSPTADLHGLDEVDAFDDGFTDGDW